MIQDSTAKMSSSLRTPSKPGMAEGPGRRPGSRGFGDAELGDAEQHIVRVMPGVRWRREGAPAAGRPDRGCATPAGLQSRTVAARTTLDVDSFARHQQLGIVRPQHGGRIGAAVRHQERDAASASANTGVAIQAMRGVMDWEGPIGRR